MGLVPSSLQVRNYCDHMGQHNPDQLSGEAFPLPWWWQKYQTCIGPSTDSSQGRLSNMQHQYQQTDHRHNTLSYTILVASLLWTDTTSGFVLNPSSADRTERSEKLLICSLGLPTHPALLILRGRQGGMCQQHWHCNPPHPSPPFNTHTLNPLNLKAKLVFYAFPLTDHIPRWPQQTAFHLLEAPLHLLYTLQS